MSCAILFIIIIIIIIIIITLIIIIIIIVPQFLEKLDDAGPEAEFNLRHTQVREQEEEERWWWRQ